MAIPTTIETLLDGQVVEWARIEFKETWDPQASLKTICAFANDIDNWGGGYIVIGVHETRGRHEAIGVPEEMVDGWLKDMLNKCKLIQPPYMPITEVCTYKGKTFIVIWAPGGSQRPYSSPKSMGKKSERVCWIRKMASTVEPTHEEQVDLYNLANNVPFDDRINHAADISDLSLPLIRSYLKKTGSSLYSRADTMDFVELCRSMNIVDGPTEYVKPKNVGLLFFSSNPERFFPYAAHIDIVELPDGEGGDRIFEHSFAGPLDAQLEGALRYLQNNVIEEAITKLPDKAEAERYFNYPYQAIEEALANAVYHKGYDTREPIEVRVLPDRIEILSHPGADRSITIDNLKQFRAVSRRYRNRRVGEFLKELHLTEGRNTGIHKMLQSLAENGSPEPLLETDEDRIYFLTTIYKRNLAERQDAPSPRSQAIAERRERLLVYLSEHPASSLAEASVSLGVSRATTNRDMAELRAQGRIRHEGASRTGRWIVL
jgi:ATP-dependent DNA helicase RecG